MRGRRNQKPRLIRRLRMPHLELLVAMTRTGTLSAEQPKGRGLGEVNLLGREAKDRS
jgi:hypothetical protein